MSDRREPRPIPEEPPFKAYVGNLPLDLVPSDLDSMFENFAVIDAKMIRDYENDRFKGFAYVEFRTQEDLKSALALDGANYDGRILRIDVADAPRERERRSGGRGGFGGRGGNFRGGQSLRGDNRRGGSYSGERIGNRSDNVDHDRSGRSGLGRGKSHPPDTDSIPHAKAPGRRQLKLQPRTTDPEELERLKKIEEEETKKRQARIFGMKE
ncbi:unnamed protein product [Thelazia callipaeda]|uniref:RRM domain-containing protein n=1 Tax=Thelazia callipaeda TaxID=103827 RepID=A0A0N5CYF3_THECL|nr:unnamed protein product [Thelazia callipaeda]